VPNFWDFCLEQKKRWLTQQKENHEGFGIHQTKSNTTLLHANYKSDWNELVIQVL
jgi:hypothetical protein